VTGGQKEVSHSRLTPEHWLKGHFRAVAQISAVRGALSTAYGSGRSASCPAESKANREASDPREDEDTREAVPMMDGDEHHDPESNHDETGYKPKGDEALPAVVDYCTVTRPRTGSL
jgi:hypothetical protein